MKFIQKAKIFLADERGSNAIEYGLIASLIAVAIIGAVQLVSTDLVATFNAIAAAL
jgi:pilus assembly protein Flp/PilA